MSGSPFRSSQTEGGVIMASIRKKRTAAGTTIYQARWQEPGKNGRLRQKSKNFGKHADAKSYATRMAQEIERRGVGDPENHTLGRYLTRWRATLAAGGEYAPTTLSLYTSNIGLLTGDVGGIGDIPLARLSAHDIDQAMMRLKKNGSRGKGRGKKGRGGPLTAKTLLSVFQMLRAALEQARRWRFIPENPAKDARAPTPQRSQAKPFSADEVSRLFTAAIDDPEPDTYLLAAILLLGLRRSEVLGLAFDTCDLDANQIEIRRTVVDVDHRPLLREHAKTDASVRTIAMPQVVVDLLKVQKVRILETALAFGREYSREPLLCFPGWAGGPMDPQRLTIRFRRLMQKIGIVGRAPLHGWRHTSATVILNETKNIKLVQSRLGHASAAFTMQVYAHAIDSADRSAADHLGEVISGGRKP
jgi:integrase